MTSLSSRRPSWLALLLGAILVVFGMQLIRVLLPLLIWHLHDVRGISSPMLGLMMALSGLAPLLAPLLLRMLGPKNGLRLALGAVLLARMIEQVVTAPAADVWLSMAGWMAFLAALPLWLAMLRRRGEPGTTLVGALLLGLTLDTTIKSFGQTLDPSWIVGTLPLLSVMGLSMLAAILLRSSEIMANAAAATESDWTAAIAIGALGPFLVLQAVVFQNSGWVAAVGGIDGGLAILLVLLGDVVAAAGATWAASRHHWRRPLLAFAAGAYWVLALTQVERSGAGFIAIVLVSQFLLGWAWMMIADRALTPAGPGIGRTTVGVLISAFLFVGLSFFYYASLDVPLPFDRALVFPLAGALMGGCLLLAVGRRQRSMADLPASPALPLATGALMLLAAIVLGIRASASADQAPSVQAERIMTYNIHSAFDVAGQHVPHLIAAAIADQQAGAVALQEVSRGWLISGSTDMLYWLTQRLDMHAVFQGTSDPVWGNALLTASPPIASGAGTLPQDGSLIARGYLWAELEAPAGETWLVVGTHFHHLAGDDQLRADQARAMLAFWNGRPRTILLGDLNAIPGDPAIEMMLAAGLTDAWTAGDGSDGYTFRADDPYERIDWIFSTPDLTPSAAEVLPLDASDHRPVVASYHSEP